MQRVARLEPLQVGALEDGHVAARDSDNVRIALAAREHSHLADELTHRARRRERRPVDELCATAGSAARGRGRGRGRGLRRTGESEPSRMTPKKVACSLKWITFSPVSNSRMANSCACHGFHCPLFC